MDQNHGKMDGNKRGIWIKMRFKSWKNETFEWFSHTVYYATVILSQSRYLNEIILHHNGATNAFCTRLISAYFKELGITHIPILD